MSKTLKDLVIHSNRITEILAETGGELTPELESEIAHVDLALPQKVDGYVVTLDRMMAEAEYFKLKAEEFLAVSKGIVNARELLMGHLKACMEMMQVSEIQGNDWRFKIQSAAPAVKISNEDLIPKEYTREVVEIKIDKKRIAEDLKLSVPVPGAHLETTTYVRSYVNKASDRKKANNE
jgi:hypothetical protein